MKSFLLLLSLVIAAGATDFTSASRFDSVEAFVAAVKALKPSSNKGDLAALFSVEEPRQPEEPKKVLSPESISEVDVLWSNEEKAMVFAKADPVSEVTNLKVATLFHLQSEAGTWRVVDHAKFTAFGKYAKIIAELASSGSVETLYENPLVKIEEIFGGRLSSSRLSATYTAEGMKIKRLDLK